MDVFAEPQKYPQNCKIHWSLITYNLPFLKNLSIIKVNFWLFLKFYILENKFPYSMSCKWPHMHVHEHGCQCAYW